MKFEEEIKELDLEIKMQEYADKRFNEIEKCIDDVQQEVTEVLKQSETLAEQVLNIEDEQDEKKELLAILNLVVGVINTDLRMKSLKYFNEHEKKIIVSDLYSDEYIDQYKENFIKQNFHLQVKYFFQDKENFNIKKLLSRYQNHKEIYFEKLEKIKIETIESVMRNTHDRLNALTSIQYLHDNTTSFSAYLVQEELSQDRKSLDEVFRIKHDLKPYNPKDEILKLTYRLLILNKIIEEKEERITLK